MGSKVCGGVEGIEACGTETGATREVASGAEGTKWDSGETGAGGSPVCSAIGDKSRRGLSTSDSSSSDPRRGKMESSRPGLPSINGKGGLTAAEMLYTRLGREPNMLKHLK